MTDNINIKNEKLDGELVKLLKEFLELEIVQLRLVKQEKEERNLELGQYGEDVYDEYHIPYRNRSIVI